MEIDHIEWSCREGREQNANPTYQIIPFCTVILLILLRKLLVKVAALRVTDSARARILKAGGEVITIDQLAIRAPKGENTLFIQASI